MFTSLALATAIAHPGGPGFGFALFFLIPLFVFIVLAVVFAIFGRRRRAAWAASGYGPWGYGHGGPGFGGHGAGFWAQAQAARSAETTLAERFAQGDIDEKEYRARLEVLRASVPQPPVPPQA